MLPCVEACVEEDHTVTDSNLPVATGTVVSRAFGTVLQSEDAGFEEIANIIPEASLKSG